MPRPSVIPDLLLGLPRKQRLAKSSAPAKSSCCLFLSIKFYWHTTASCLFTCSSSLAGFALIQQSGEVGTETIFRGPATPKYLFPALFKTSLPALSWIVIKEATDSFLDLRTVPGLASSACYHHLFFFHLITARGYL